MIKLKYFWYRNHCQIEFSYWDKLFWPIWQNPNFLPILGHFLPLQIKNNSWCLSLNIHFASKQNRFFRNWTKNLGKTVIYPTWPNLAFKRLSLDLHGVLFTNMYRPTLGWGQKWFQKFYWNSGWFFTVIKC